MFGVDSRSTDEVDEAAVVRVGDCLTVVVPREWCATCRRRPRTLEEMTKKVVLDAAVVERKEN